jgi:hypothetical protein
MAVADFIQAGSASGNYLTYRDVLNFVEREFRSCLTHSWTRSLLGWNEDVVQAKPVFSQEKVWLEVPRQFLEEDTKLIKESVPWVPSEQTVNIDKGGFNDLDEQKDELFIIPAEARVSALYHQANR